MNLLTQGQCMVTYSIIAEHIVHSYIHSTAAAHIKADLTSLSCPSKAASDWLLHPLCTNITEWFNFHPHLHFHKTSSHLCHLDKKRNTALRWLHPFLVSVTSQWRVSHLPQHTDCDGETPRTLQMSGHDWSMGESTVLHTNCHKRFDSARLVHVYTYITTIESSTYKLIAM